MKGCRAKLRFAYFLLHSSFVSFFNKHGEIINEIQQELYIFVKYEKNRKNLYKKIRDEAFEDWTLILVLCNLFFSLI